MNLLAQVWLISPLVAIFATALVVLIVDVVQEEPCRSTSLGITILGLVAAAGLNCAVGMGLAKAQLAFSGMVVVDGYAVFIQFVLILAALGTLLLGHDHFERIGVSIPEVRPLLLFSLMGMMLMALSAELMMLFIAIEVMSIALYVLCGVNRSSEKGVESAFKYFVLGSFSTAILLYGIALIWGATGSTQFSEIAMWLRQGHTIMGTPMMAAGVAMLLVGLAFKVAAVPFHMWSPDVYEGAPTPITAFMATGVKVASFAAIGRVLFSALLLGHGDWVDALVWLSGLTILVGNVAALVQDNLKRMLAYSSISHAGYLLMAVVAVSPEGGVAGNPQLGGVLFYLLSYTLMTIGAFAVVSLLARDGEEDASVTQLAGLAGRHPWVAAGMAVCLLSLAGIPPTMGFIGKFYVFTAAINGGFYSLAIVGAVGGAVGVYYYLRPIVMMYMHEAEEEVPMAINLPAMGALGLGAGSMLVFGLMPGPVVDWCRTALLSMMGA